MRPLAAVAGRLRLVRPRDGASAPLFGAAASQTRSSRRANPSHQAQPGRAAESRGRMVTRPLVLAVAGSAAPVVLYFVARLFAGGDALALAIGVAAPAVGTAIVAVWRRQVRIFGVLAAVAFGVALAATVMTGGSTLPLKLYRPVGTGVLGLVLLGSVLTRRPLLLPILRVLSSRAAIPPIPLRSSAAAPPVPAWPSPASQASGSPRSHQQPRWQRAAAVTAIAGLTLLIEALATGLLAFTTSTGVFLVVSRLIRVAIVLAGAAAAAWYLRPGEPRRRDGPQQEGPREGGMRRPWFGPRRYGVGWKPQTWQGWLIVAVVIALVVAARTLLRVSVR